MKKEILGIIQGCIHTEKGLCQTCTDAVRVRVERAEGGLDVEQ